MSNNISEFRKPGTVPKTVAEVYENQRYVLKFQPKAPPEERWHYTVKFVRTYAFEGFASTEAAARLAARTVIRKQSRRDAD